MEGEGLGGAVAMGVAIIESLDYKNEHLQNTVKSKFNWHASIILLCFAWYTVWGEGNNKGDYWTAYSIDRQCIKTQNPQSWLCYRAEIHRNNSLSLANWGMTCGLIGTIATVGLALSKKD